MKSVEINTLIILLVLLLSACNYSQIQHSENSEIKMETTPTQIPKNWKLIDLDDFSFLLPDSMKDKKAKGIDTEVWVFENSEIKLLIENGGDINNFEDLNEFYEVKTEKVFIDNKNVEFFIWDYNKEIFNSTKMDKKSGETQPPKINEKHFVIAVYFQTGESRYEGVSFQIFTKTMEQQETARKILQSIKFKK